MPNLLITGANGGLGLELVKQYSAEGWKIHACCRSPEKAKDLKGVLVHPLNVLDITSIKALAKKLEGEPIDLLINCAGIYGDGAPTLQQSNFSSWSESFQVNTFAPIIIAEAFLSNIAKSEKKKIVSITSKMGSIALTGEAGRYDYQGSKAALNKMTKVLSYELQDRGIISVVIHPGWVRTKMGGPKAPLEAVNSVAAIRKLIASLTLKDTGKFLNYDGQEIPW